VSRRALRRFKTTPFDVETRNVGVDESDGGRLDESEGEEKDEDRVDDPDEERRCCLKRLKSEFYKRAEKSAPKCSGERES